MPTPTDATSRSVLIVDQSADNREVLRTVLSRRGWTIYEADGARDGVRLAQQHHPGVIVLDMESDSATDIDVQAELDRRTDEDASQLVLLGTVSVPPMRSCVVGKPYHFGPLIRTIERMIATGASAQSDCRTDPTRDAA